MIQWTRQQPPIGGVKPQHIDMSHDGRRLHPIACVIRYYSTYSGWRLIYQHDSSHPPVNVSGATSNSSGITITHNTSSMGSDLRVGGYQVGFDEDLAAYPITVGASVGTSTSTLTLWRPSAYDYVYYNGSAWVSNNGVYSIYSFASGKLTLIANSGKYPEYRLNTAPGLIPTVMVRDYPYIVTLDSMGYSGEAPKIEIVCYDTSGTKVTAANTNMRFHITDPRCATRLDPNSDFTSGHGNIWITGWLTSAR